MRKLAGRGKREGRNNLIGIILEGTTRVSVHCSASVLACLGPGE